MEVLLVVYDKESFEVSGKLFSDIRSYIGDSDTDYDAVYRSYTPIETSGRNVAGSPAKQSSDRNMPKSSGRRDLLDRFLNRDRAESREVKGALPEMKEASSIDADYDLREDEDVEASYELSYMPAFPGEAKSLEDRLEHLDKTFQQYLFMLIDRRGLTDPEVYKKANIDRKHFSKIRSNVDYSPSKKTALALAIALELSLDETKDLLGRAGLALSPSIMSDKIIEYCIETCNYDIYEINCILFKYDQPTLGV